MAPGRWLGLVALALSACAAPPPPELCDAFLTMIVRERPVEAPVLSKESLELKRQECLDHHEPWSREDPEGYRVMASCTIRQPSPVGWARCGFLQRGENLVFDAHRRR